MERLHGFLLNTEEKHAARQLEPIEVSDGLILESVALYRRSGEVLLNDININLKNGNSLLIRDPSGCGKASLLRALTEPRPFDSSGKINHSPYQNIPFPPQRPHTAQGNPRDAIRYPDIDHHHPRSAEAMSTCRLGYLIDKLDKTDDWQHKLSPGELQRIVLVRALLSQPGIILFDEATTTLDEPTEVLLYRALKQKLPDSIIISTGYRSAFNEFHDLCLDVGHVQC